MREWVKRHTISGKRHTLSANTFHMPCTPWTFAWPPNLPSVPTSRDTRVTSLARVKSCLTIELMLSFKSSISPCTSTSTNLLKSPRAMALVTTAIDRT